jgi:hypothetical protein
MEKHLAACLHFLLLSGICRAESVDLPYAEYPSKVESPSRPIQLKLTTTESRRYATQLREAAGGKVNFAGRFVLAEWGCGAACVMGAAIDSNTGKVVMLPFTVSDWPPEITSPLAFRKDSALLIVRGSRNEHGHGTYYYRFDGSAFTPLEMDSPAEVTAPTPPPPPSTPAQQDSDTAPGRRTSTVRFPSKA